MTNAKTRFTFLFAAMVLAIAVFSPSVASASEDCLGNPASGFGVGPGCLDNRLAADATENVVFTRAAATPYSLVTSIDFNTRENPDAAPPVKWPVEPARDIFVDLPVGLVGNVAAVPRCTLEQLASPVEVSYNPLCPPSTQVGRAVLRLNTGAAFPVKSALYNIDPPPGVLARLGFNIFGSITVLDAELRHSGGAYHITFASRNVNEALPLTGSTVITWGAPASPIHDPERNCPSRSPPEQSGVSCEAETTPISFLRMPTSCTAPGEGLISSLQADSWLNPGALRADGLVDFSDPRWAQATSIGHQLSGDPSPGEPAGTGECDQVPFEPVISVKPTTKQADSPSGLEVDLTVPQDELTDPEAIAQSDLRKAVVTLPEGMSVNPSSVDGLGTCSSAQIDLNGQNTEPSCPDNSKIGTAQIDTPVLPDPAIGSVYLAAQGDNPFGSLLALYISVKVRGQVIKLAGQVTPTPSGRLITTFDDNPQLPFSKLHLVLMSGSRAPLRTPPSCGTHVTAVSLTPWSGNAPVELTSSFQITEGPGGTPCPSGQFDPHLSAGSESPLAATYTPFNLRLTRDEGSQGLAGLTATLPPGLAAKFAGVPYCPESALASVSDAEGTAAAQLASPSCPASQIGTVTVGAGAGPTPFYLRTGKVYLAGPYKGAPMSLAVITPVAAGPFDLGSVLVRTALQIDPTTAQGRAVSDPLPTTLHGIALDLRDLRVNLNRPGFTLNPTNCEPLSVNAQITGTSGASASRSDAFQVANCASLAFKPSLKLRLKGGTRRGDHPAFSAALQMPPGGANIARAQVTLPHSEFLDQSHIGTVCTRVQYAANSCPARSVYGFAKATTPLLDQPLRGPVYLRSSSHKLPDLVADLNGQIHVDLAGRIDAVNGGIRNTFELVPDAPVTKFVLTMKGGKKGLLQNSTNLCTRAHRATALFDGQNGKTRDFRPTLEVQCATKRRGKGGH